MPKLDTTALIFVSTVAFAVFGVIGCSDNPPTGTGGSKSDGGAAPLGGEGGESSAPEAEFEGVSVKPVIYQLVVRHFGNANQTRAKDGAIEQNGSGKFGDINDAAIASLKDMGVTHVWLTGVLRQATLTDYSSLGMPADDPDIVKGRAGSFYAIRDYYDVSPDYAENPAERLSEFTALLERIHEANLKVLIDLVPNHVSRSYASVVRPEMDFGLGDDQTQFFSNANNFFYLVDPPGQALHLAKPAGWNPNGVTFDGLFALEDGSAGHVPRATGNNVTSPTPSDLDWYETVKLNYGFNFADASSQYEPRPNTWEKMADILAYWQGLGVDGFRVDFAHYIPAEAWMYLLNQARERNAETYFVAEAYDNLDGLLAAGFDAVYHDAFYDSLKLLYLGKRSQTDLDAVLGSLGDDKRGAYVHYLENHDERRVASAVVPGDDSGATGFGSANAGKQLGPLAYLASNGPVLIHNGQEVGETGAGVEGFGGEDGRTSIFDYWSLPVLSRWGNNHKYDGAELTPEEKGLRTFYQDLLQLGQDETIRGGRFWGLEYVNNSAASTGANDELFSFARFATERGRLAIVVVNLGSGTQVGTIRVPKDLSEAAGLDAEEQLRVREVLSDEGAVDNAIGALDVSELSDDGFEVSLEDQTARVYFIER